MNEPSQEAEREAAFADEQHRVGVVERSHEWVRGHLADLGDGSIGPRERELVEGHLASCRDCAAFQRTLKRTVRLVQGLPARKAPAGAKRRILDALP